MPLIVAVYRSAQKEGMYLFVEKQRPLEDAVPEALRERFGRAELAMTLALTEDRKLARADGARVLAAIREQGFYLQIPPVAPAGPLKGEGE